MALGLDSTAHPSGNAASLVALKFSSLAAWTSITTPSFSTGAGPVLLVALGANDGNDFTSGSGAGLTWTQRVAGTNGTAPWNGSIWTAFSATGSLSGVSVSLSKAGSNSSTAFLTVLVINGVASTEAASIGTIGTPAGADASGTVHATITPAATGSWLLGLFNQENDNAVLTADSNTTPWDSSVDAALVTASIGPASTTLTAGAPSQGTIHVADPVNGAGVTAGTVINAFGTGTGGAGTYTVSVSQTIGSEAMTIGPLTDSFYAGRYKSGGTVALTTASTPVTFGSSTSDAFWGAAVIEIKAGGAFAPDEDFMPPFRQQPDQSIISVWG